MSLHSYHSRQTPGMSVSVDVGETREHCKFVNHLYQTDDDEIAEAIDYAMTKSMALRQKIGKIMRQPRGHLRGQLLFVGL